MLQKINSEKSGSARPQPAGVLPILTGCLLAWSLTGVSGTCLAQTAPAAATSSETAPSQIMSEWWKQRVTQKFQDWDQRYATLTTPEAITAYQKDLRDRFVANLGGFPERTELNPKVTGVVARDGYRVEKVIFESQPKHFVTGLCYVPNDPKFKAPYPAVVVVCGHSATGKELEVYQAGTALLALNGIIGFIIDPICQGERYEHLDESGKITVPSTTSGHSLVGCGSILIGHNTARNEIWDGMRAIDYLQQRDDVNPEKIGCMGNSGGGTQTSYLMALDDRIKAAAPSCYITSFEKLLSEMGPQDAEQNIHGQLAWGMGHADYLFMRAPSSVLVCAATQDMFPIDGTWDSFRKARKIYTRLGYSNRLDLIDADGKHGWNQPLREAAVQWMCRWLYGRDIVVREPKLQPLTKQEAQVTEKGQVLLIEGARSAVQLNHDEFKRLQKDRDQLWSDPKAALEKVREIAGIRAASDLPKLAATKQGESKVGDLTVESWSFQNPDGTRMSADVYVPAKVTQAPLLWITPGGKTGAIEEAGKKLTAKEAATAGRVVIALDLRGTGETAPEKATWYDKRFGPDGRHLVTAYLLGQSYVGIWAEEILQVAHWAQQQKAIMGDAKTLDIIARGRVALPALHAAAVEQQMFGAVKLVNSLPSWEVIVSSPLSQDQLVNCVHGATRAYDIPHLVKTLGDRCQLVAPVNSMGVPTP